jgi:3-dehydroquinate dehydratase II
MKILIINGPNLNLLGKRNKNLYGILTLEHINLKLEEIAHNNGVSLIFFQSNHEGKIIDFIQDNFNTSSGILINPGAFTHYSIAIRDALDDSKLPIVEVHLTDITKREDFRKKDILDGIVIARFMGNKINSYTDGLTYLISYLKGKYNGH